MRAFGAEFRRRRECPPTLLAGTQQRRRTLFTELRGDVALVLATRTLHHCLRGRARSGQSAESSVHGGNGQERRCLLAIGLKEQRASRSLSWPADAWLRSMS